MKPNSRAPKTIDQVALTTSKPCTQGDADESDALQERAFTALSDALPQSDAPVGVAVSGGSDSLSLLYLAHAWATAHGQKLRAVTVDHGLRPEAATEADWVSSICAARGISHDILQWSPPASAIPAGSVGQATARQARHDLLAQWAARHQISHILLGHTQDDAIETCLMRLRAGSGWHGLAALQPVSASPAWPHGLGLTLVRPLLDVSRTQLRVWLNARDQTWIDDPSNDNRAYERIRMRQLIPRLSPDVIARFPLMLDQLRALRRAQTAAILGHVTNHVTWRDDGGAVLNCHWLNALPEQLAERMLALIAMCVSGAPTPLRRAHITALRELAAAAAPRNTFMAGNAWAVAENDTLTIYRRPQGGGRSSGAPDLPPRAINPGDSLIWDGRFRICLSHNAKLSGQIICLDHARRVSADLPPPPERATPRGKRMLPVLLTEDAIGHFPALGASHDPDRTFTATPLSCARARHLLSCEL